jgi:hypothetical protein
MSTIKFEILKTVNFKVSRFVPDTTVSEHTVQGTHVATNRRPLMEVQETGREEI